MALSYIDEAGNGKYGYFHQHELSSLTRLLLEPEDPSDGIKKSFRLVHLLLLSNHIEQADSLIRALYRYSDTIVPAPFRSNRSYAPYCSLAMEYFWLTHPTYGRPEVTGDESREPPIDSTAETRLRNQQWNEYRECTRTGWMLKHCNLPEPADPHVWRETDDAAMIAMCARLLAKNKTPNEFPPQEQIQEALAAAKKLYAQPQVPVTEWDWKGSGSVRRHSYLLYRRLVVELAIKTGDLETAAEVLSLGLRLDGFNNADGGQLERYLFLPGIYEVLPLLAQKGKDGNPFFIEEPRAVALVRKITSTLELRAKEGRQWSLAPDKVSWSELLDRLAKGAWKVNRKEYRSLGVTCAKNILFKPASEEQIRAAEDKVGALPEDFKEMVRVANGFQGGWHFLSGGISGVDSIDIADEDLDNYANDFGDYELKLDDVSGDMIRLEPGSECDEFCHFIIPPALWRDVFEGDIKDGEYRYWHWANWQGGISAWNSVWDWVASCVEDVEAMVERGERMKFDSGEEGDSEDDESRETREGGEKLGV